MTESNHPEISIIVPIFNEEENLPELTAQIVKGIEPLQTSYEILLVDDGSTDGSLAILDTLKSQYPTLSVLQFTRNAGQSAALHAGLNKARGNLLVSLDGDLQNDPDDIPRLVGLLKDFDLVCGYRAKRKDTTAKRIASRIANFVRSRFVGDGVRDTGCTLKAYRKEVVTALPLFRGMHRFIPALIKGAGFTVTEVAVNHRPRIHGVSKYSVAGRAWKATMDMFGVRWLNSRLCPYKIKN
ncbi:MAG: glycosyltransferase family 2 protein [Verrucomicrobiota bacterium]|nr:glycosyltransferase family 2 protein [Verrucomicrobiota bacterium]